MTKIKYLAREIVHNQINETIKFTTTATVIRNNGELWINYQEKLSDQAHCQLYYNGQNIIIIERISAKIKNRLQIKKGESVTNEYLTLSGTTKLSTFGKEITINLLKDQTEVLKFVYDLYQNGEFINQHEIYLQIKA